MPAYNRERCPACEAGVTFSPDRFSPEVVCPACETEFVIGPEGELRVSPTQTSGRSAWVLTSACVALLSCIVLAGILVLSLQLPATPTPPEQKQDSSPPVAAMEPQSVEPLLSDAKDKLAKGDPVGSRILLARYVAEPNAKSRDEAVSLLSQVEQVLVQQRVDAEIKRFRDEEKAVRDLAEEKAQRREKERELALLKVARDLDLTIERARKSDMAERNFNRYAVFLSDIQFIFFERGVELAGKIYRARLDDRLTESFVHRLFQEWTDQRDWDYMLIVMTQADDLIPDIDGKRYDRTLGEAYADFMAIAATVTKHRMAVQRDLKGVGINPLNREVVDKYRRPKLPFKTKTITTEEKVLFTGGEGTVCFPSGKAVEGCTIEVRPKGVLHVRVGMYARTYRPSAVKSIVSNEVVYIYDADEGGYWAQVKRTTEVPDLD